MTTDPAAARLALGFSAVGHAFSHMFMLLFPTAVLTLEHAWGMPYADLIGLAWWGLFLFGAAALPAGWLGDKWSAAWMMTIFFLGLGLSSIAAGFARDPLELTLALAAIGLFASIYHPVGIAWLVRNAAQRGKALGLNGVFGSAGIGLAAPLAAGLAALWGWQAAFLVPGVVALAVGLAMAWCVATGRVPARQTADMRREAEPSGADARRAFLVLSVTMLCVGLINNTAIYGLPKLVDERLGAEAAGLGIGGSLLVAAVFVLTGAAQIVGGWLSDRLPMRQVYVGLYIVQVPLLALAAGIASPYGLYALVAVTMAMQSASLATENGLLARYTPSGWRATAFGAKFVLALGLSSLGTLLLAHIQGTTGSVQPIFWAFALFAAVVAGAGLLLPGEPRAAPAPAPAPAE